MQENYSENRLFLERTDEIARITRVSLRELAPKIGISVASLFGYRSGNIKISPKAWRKLEQAELAAGIEIDRTGTPEVTGTGTKNFPAKEDTGNEYLIGKNAELDDDFNPYATKNETQVLNRLTDVENQLKILTHTVAKLLEEIQKSKS